MNFRTWQVPKPDETTAAKLAAAIGAPGLLARILVARGLDSPEKAMAFLTQDAPLSDPFALKDMDKAAARILKAVDAGEPIVIFGDYDVDGVTATALLFEHLRGMGASVRCKLPSRDEEGYGLTVPIVESLAEKGFKLIITVDNGVSAVQEIKRAAELGMDVVVTDHHLPGEALPEAVAVVDPARADDESPFKCLSGAGVAFKLCAALDGCPPEELLEQCGDLAAIGTVADVMPLVGENRTIVKHGLAALENCERPGLVALLEGCGLGDRPVTAENISFALAPRLNAAGRMETAATALQLLLCEDFEKAQALTERLNQANADRQAAEQAILNEVEAQIAADPSRLRDRVLLVWGEGFHPGVIGIVASRLVEKYGRPAVVISVQNGEGKGSGRSVPGFNLHGAISACAPVLIRFGGHAMAAGLSVREEDIPALRRAINEYAAREHPVLQAPPLRLDAAVRLDALNVADVESLSYLAPCGHENPAPVFFLGDAVVDGTFPVSDGKHTRVRLRQGGASIFAVCFGTAPAQLAYQPGDRVDAALTLSVYEGKNGPQLSARVRALRPAGLPDEAVRQAALYEAFNCGASLTKEEKRLLLPDRAHIASLYRLIRQGSVSAEDPLPLLARMGAENTGRTLTGLKALRQLGLVQVRRENGARRLAPAAVEGKKDLSAAPILKALEA